MVAGYSLVAARGRSGKGGCGGETAVVVGAEEQREGWLWLAQRRRENGGCGCEIVVVVGAEEKREGRVWLA